MTDELIYTRDLDGTGSQHACSKGDPDAIAWVRADRIEALTARVAQLEEAIRRDAVRRMTELVNWLDEDEDNAALLLAHMTPEEIDRARAALTSTDKPEQEADHDED